MVRELQASPQSESSRKGEEVLKVVKRRVVVAAIVEKFRDRGVGVRERIDAVGAACEDHLQA